MMPTLKVDGLVVFAAVHLIEVPMHLRPSFTIWLDQIVVRWNEEGVDKASYEAAAYYIRQWFFPNGLDDKDVQWRQLAQRAMSIFAFR